jgi:peptidoglycan/LPS O-acetylase OafA/YrhL
METKAVTRRYDLDWLRVMGILTVFIYHSARFFNSETWHVKNATTYFGVDVWETILSNWMMPLIFAISGASLFYALGKGKPGQFITDKVLRLLVPLLFGMFTLDIVQMYFDRLTHGMFSGSLIEFLPHYFLDGLDGFGGNFPWTGVHLWYLEMLFIFSLVFLPLFLWLKHGTGQRVLAWLGNLLAQPGAAYLLALPVMLLVGLMNRNTFWGSLGWGGGSIFSHLCFFLSGFVIVSHAGLQNSIQRLRWLSLTLVAILLVTIFTGYMLFGDPVFGTAQYTLFFSLYGLWAWCWVLAILGFGMKHLNFTTPVLQRANEAVLPFYILHQPVLLCVGFFVVRWAIPDLLKWAIIMPTSFVIIVTLYEFLVRRFNVMRVLFGMKPLKQAAPLATRPVQPAPEKA